MPTIRVNDVSLYYEEYGTGESILCIHGTGSSTALWRDPATALATRGRAIVYDRRGFGASERPEPFVTDVHLQADDAAALLDALGAAPAVVIGRSHGGEIAADLALRYPDRVRALALLEGGGLMLGPAFRRWLAPLHERLFAAAEADPATVGEVFLRDVLGDAGWEALPDAVRDVFTANGPAIVAEERGGLLDASADRARDDRRADTDRRRQGLRAGVRRGDGADGEGDAGGKGRVGRGRAPDRCRPPGGAGLRRRRPRPIERPSTLGYVG